VVLARIQGRRICQGCGVDYNLMFHRPLTDGRCDVCGGTLIQRKDDNEQAVQARLRDYHQKTQPILDLFRNKELVITADGTQPPADVQRDILRQISTRPAAARESD
jgi:adenylate kinase